MEISQLISTLQEQYSSSVLEIGSFGKIQELVCVSVTSQSAHKILAVLKNEFAFTDFVSLIISEIFSETPGQPGCLRLSYFIRHQQSGSELVVRTVFEISDTDQIAIIPSVSKIWISSTSFEKEYGDLFGIFFEGNEYFEKSKKRYLLPEMWEGFPLRKDYVYPMEFLDIPHTRPVGQSAPDEYGSGGR